ncbi:MAG: DUF4214 domain-containing protein, partial [Rhodopila sp.]
VPIVVVPSTAPGFGEIAIGGTILSDIPAPVNGVSTMTLTSTELSALLQGDQSAMRFVVGTEEVRLVDGTLSVGPDTTEAFVARLYAGLLGRAPDPVGLAAWTTALESGLSPVTAANACLASPEYQASHAEQDTTTFINTLYQSMLGRAAEPEGFAAWSQALGSGVTRGEMVAAAANSPEARQHWAALTGQGWFARDPDAAVIRVDYLAGLGRDADAGGLAAWTSVLKSGASPDQVAAAMTASPEFQTLHAQQLDSEYVNSLYLAGFGRPADPGGLAAWSNAISSGSVSRAQFLSLVAASPEAQAHVPWALN